MKHAPNTATSASVRSIANQILLASKIIGNSKIIAPLITIPREMEEIIEREGFIIDWK